MDEKEKLSTLAVVPLYKQLKRLLEDALNDGTWKPGESLPSEPELAREYGVSRITVRTALNELSKEGRLVRLQGKGTFVTQKKGKSLFTVSANSFSESCEKGGFVPGRQVVSLSIEPAGGEDQEVLHLPPESLVVKVTRLLLVDGVPLIYAVDHLLPAYSYLRAEDLEKESLNALMTRDGPSRTLTSRERTFEAVAADPVQARLLGIPAGEPLLLVYDVVVDENGVPLRYTREFVAGDKVKYAYILPPEKA
ncbi:MAG: GntR family transcriptional regulator [Clostridiales bacterium]|nr:GntR family transcriptional regulator [Clostridiales bacterium]